MKHQVWYDKQNEILRLQVVDFFSTQESREIGQLYPDQLKERPYKQLVVDLSQAGEMENRETRKIQNESLKQAGITDVAYVGASAATRMIAKVLMKLGSLNAKSEFFKSDDKAIKWLRDQRRAK